MRLVILDQSRLQDQFIFRHPFDVRMQGYPASTTALLKAYIQYT